MKKAFTYQSSIDLVNWKKIYLDNSAKLIITNYYPINDDTNVFKQIGFYLLLALLVLITLWKFVGIGLVIVNGHSMDPTLHNGELLVGYDTNNFVKNIPKLNQLNQIKRGNIVIFHASNVDPRDDDSTYYIKRVIGEPGDKISFNGKYIKVNNRKFIVNSAYHKSIGSMNNAQALTKNDKTLSKWNLQTLSTRKWNNNGTMYYWNMKSINTKVVPKGSYFVMGDNRSISNDSREFGYVPQKDIMYKVCSENLF